MSQLLAILDEYREAHGNPSDSSIAAAIGISRGTISNWRRRGIKESPDEDILMALAEYMGLPFEEWVLQAVLVDTRRLREMPPPPPEVSDWRLQNELRMKRRRRPRRKSG